MSQLQLLAVGCDGSLSTQSRNRLKKAIPSTVDDLDVNCLAHKIDFGNDLSLKKLVEYRICQDEDFDSNMETPCSCCGSLKFVTIKNKNGNITIRDLPPLMVKLNGISEMLTEEEVKAILDASGYDMSNEIDFEPFLRTYLTLQSQAMAKVGGPKKSLSSFLKASTTTLLHTINESEKSTYVAHTNIYLADDPFLKKYLPLDPLTNDLFDLANDGVLLCKLINVVVPGTIDERATNTKRVLNPWERNENHTLCLNSAKAICCTVVNIGTQDLIEGRPHLVLGLISQIIKIQLLANLNLKKTPQLVELVEDSTDVEELMSLAPEKVLLKWMNFHLKKAGYKKPVNNFSSDEKVW